MTILELFALIFQDSIFHWTMIIWVVVWKIFCIFGTLGIEEMIQFDKTYLSNGWLNHRVENSPVELFTSTEMRTENERFMFFVLQLFHTAPLRTLVFLWEHVWFLVACLGNMLTIMDDSWWWWGWRNKAVHTVDERNPKQPPGMYKFPVKNGWYTTNLNWWSPDFLTSNTNSQPFEYPCWTSDLWMLRKATLPLEAAKEAGPGFATRWRPTQKKTVLNVSLFQLTRWFSVFF